MHILLNRLHTMMAKTNAIPSLHRDYLPAKETGQLPGAASGNTTYLYCRAVSVNNGCRYIVINCTLYTYSLAPGGLRS